MKKEGMKIMGEYWVSFGGVCKVGRVESATDEP